MDDERPLRVLMVCTGNLCRSPMAELLVDRVATRLCVEVEVQSGGTAGRGGEPSPRNLVAVAREVGLDLSGHRSKRVTAEHVRWADHVLVMEAAHTQALAASFGDAAAAKVVELGPRIGKPQIDDPMGSWFKGPYRAMRDDLERALTRWLADVSGRR